jgi:Rrf2 family transcriptional regulator, cysteine metabolism repressor
MRLSAKVDYACMAVLELALHYQEEAPVQLSEIARAQAIPDKFLTQIFQRLKAAHIVGSTRGMAGGYFLAKDPANITLADVVRAVDNSLLDTHGEAEIAEGSKGRDLVLRTWNSINGCIAGQLEQVSFENLIDRMRSEQLTYYI